jgi:hypothetical protein
MVGTLNLYLDSELSYTWHQLSLLAAKAAGHGVHHTRTICTWIHQFLSHGKLPLHRYGCYHSSILQDEDFKQSIQLHLQGIAKDGYVCAQDIVDCVTMPEMQEQLGTRWTGISIHMARCWLHNMEWQYGKKRTGMYIDGHEHEDVVK